MAGNGLGRSCFRDVSCIFCWFFGQTSRLVAFVTIQQLNFQLNPFVNPCLLRRTRKIWMHWDLRFKAGRWYDEMHRSYPHFVGGRSLVLDGQTMGFNQLFWSMSNDFRTVFWLFQQDSFEFFYQWVFDMRYPPACIIVPLLESLGFDKSLPRLADEHPTQSLCISRMPLFMATTLLKSNFWVGK